MFANGETLSEVIKRQAGAASKKDERREHPLFGLVAMLILQEVCFSLIFIGLVNICKIVLFMYRLPIAGCSRW